MHNRIGLLADCEKGLENLISQTIIITNFSPVEGPFLLKVSSHHVPNWLVGVYLWVLFGFWNKYRT